MKRIMTSIYVILEELMEKKDVLIVVQRFLNFNITPGIYSFLLYNPPRYRTDFKVYYKQRLSR